MSSRRIKPRFNNPPKKKHTGLIIGIVISVIVVIIIIIVLVLVLGGKKAPTPAAVVVPRCTTNNDCASGKVCKTGTGVCVSCLTDANCSGTTAICNTNTNTCATGCLTDANCVAPTSICNVTTKTCIECATTADCTGGEVCNPATKTCIAPQCATNSDCSGATPACSGGICVQCTQNSNCTTTPATPVCDAQTCKQCNTNTDCATNSLYNGLVPPKDVCNTANHTCTECVTDLDCGGGANTCTNGVCCLLPIPVMVSINGTAGASPTISGIYALPPGSPSLTGTQQIVKLYAFNNDPAVNTEVLLYTAPTVASTGTYILTQNTIGINIFQGYEYRVKVQIVFACGISALSASALVTIPPSTKGSPGSQSGDAVAAIASVANGIIIQSVSTVTLTGWPIGAIMYKILGLHPNFATKIERNLVPVVQGFIATFGFGWAPIQPIGGEAWYFSIFYEDASTGLGISPMYTTATAVIP